LSTDHNELSEVLAPEPAEALADLLDADAPQDSVLAPLWHWVYLLDRAPKRDLGPDGHPVRGVVPTPPGPGQRRRFAGGRVRVLHPLRIGVPTTRHSRTGAPTVKYGRSGRMVFVTVHTEIEQAGVVAVVEDQDVVYLEAGPGVSAGSSSQATRSESNAPSPPTVQVEAASSFTVTPAVLFRFSALTYNAHRIHYDRDYAREVEGYSDLVVHGPLQALLMGEQLRRTANEFPVAVEFRLVAPLLLGQGLHVGCGHEAELRQGTAFVADNDGRIVATMRARWTEAGLGTDGDMRPTEAAGGVSPCLSTQ
jgi:3-methylfumaryl-CoA hydratase